MEHHDERHLPLSPTYVHAGAEGKWIPIWNKLFKGVANATSQAAPSGGESQDRSSSRAEENELLFSIIMPPPNVTGELHMGHALVSILQDVLVRWHKMRCYSVLWVPGVDHAGIATQMVVERFLLRTQGVTRFQIGRERFLENVWQWKEDHTNRIRKQLQLMGCGCDWSQFRFSMDDHSNTAVRKAFSTLFERGLIYRGHYLVNWDPHLRTALSDDEVEYRECQGNMWFIRYPVTESEEGSHILVATTRPETIWGDVAVAISPEDPRAHQLSGGSVLSPLSGKALPIIADHRVDPEFGTGIVKITPAHDPLDYEIGIDHELEMTNIMNPDGTLNELCQQWEGSSIMEARASIAEYLQKRGSVEKVESHAHRVGYSYRSQSVIEPRLSQQWFLKMKDFAPQLRSMVEEGRVELIPEHWKSTFYHWIDNLRDWCISRQLWWGHRIPIWYHRSDPDRFLCHGGKGVPREVEEAPEGWEQDEDVLDTWFSSALWPFLVLGWPEKSAEEVQSRWYPHPTLITGHDILFFWVARMMYMGLQLMGEVPFRKVFLHGLIFGRSYMYKERGAEGTGKEGGGDTSHFIATLPLEERKAYDHGKPLPPHLTSRWEKMSKSKGNVMNPLEIMDIYGTDSMRASLCSCTTSGKEIDLDYRKFEEYQHFANKLWNALRFLMKHPIQYKSEGDDCSPSAPLQGTPSALLESCWIQGQMDHTLQQVHSSLEEYSFAQTIKALYRFFWDDFCSIYLEIIKPTLMEKKDPSQARSNYLICAWSVFLRYICALHPIAPFITEEMFSHARSVLFPLHGLFPEDVREIIESEYIAAAPLPPHSSYPSLYGTFMPYLDCVHTLRNMRATAKVKPKERAQVLLQGEGWEEGRHEEGRHIIETLAHVEILHNSPNSTHSSDPFSMRQSVHSWTCTLYLPEGSKEQEVRRVKKELEKVQKRLDILKKKLNNPSFLSSAPEAIVHKAREESALLETQRDQIIHSLRTLSP